MLCRGWRSAALALVVAVAVPVTPLIRSVRSACDVCAPSCPMHRKARLSCHRAAGSDMKPARHCDGGAGLSLPGCGRGHETIVASVVFVVPPARTVAPPAPPLVVVHTTVPTSDGRGSDPPDTPPPICSA